MSAERTMPDRDSAPCPCGTCADPGDDGGLYECERDEFEELFSPAVIRFVLEHRRRMHRDGASGRLGTFVDLRAGEVTEYWPMLGATRIKAP